MNHQNSGYGGEPGELVSRTPPKALDAEQSVIGAIMFQSDVLNEIGPILRPEDFAGAHGPVYRAALDLHQSGRPVDVVSLNDRMKANGETDEAYNATLLITAMDHVYHADHVRYHADLIVSKANRRRLLYTLTHATAEIYADGIETAEIVAKVEREIDAQAERRINGQAVPISASLIDLLIDLEKPEAPGVKTGFAGIDRVTGGLKSGQMVVLAARPSVGKTSLMTGICKNVAQSSGPVLIVSQEMTKAELTARLLCSACEVGVSSLRGMMRNERQRQRLQFEAEQLGAVPILIDDQPNRRIDDIESLARLHQRKGGLSLVAIDYLGLLTPDNPKAPTEAQISQLSRGCKMLAKSLNVPVLVLCQLNRAVENREDRRPRLADLRSSGAIEQDADAVAFLDRPRLWNQDADANLATVIIAKNRNGSLADIRLDWDGPSMTFTDTDSDWHTPEDFDPFNDP